MWPYLSPTWGKNNHHAKRSVICKNNHKLHIDTIMTKIALCPLLIHKAVTFTYYEPQILLQQSDQGPVRA